MRTVSITFPKRLILLTFTFLVTGTLETPCGDYDTLACDIVRIVAAPNALCVLGGDLCDMALRNSVGDVYGNDVDPMGQVEAIVDLLSPIQRQNRLYGSRQP